MKVYRLFLLFSILSILLAPQLFSQVRVSYIQPDIAAPGMNSYIEFIAPYNANGEYGPDITYFLNATDALKLEFVNPNDANKIAFGPLVVSWQGRMVSTQIFVHPWVQPNTWEWNNLNSEFIVPIRLNYNGIQSNPINLYIVKPFNFGDKRSNPERVLGAGSLGRRSPRGAMIVDSMLLGSGKYTVSTADTDPNISGNQGYLPFILISQGKIIGDATTVISVDGGTEGGQAKVQDAGPGGGGGGGRFFDAGFPCNNSQNGDDGGNGFTGGGAGGRNNGSLPGVNNSYKLTGIGTFEDANIAPNRGFSLNGVPPSITLAYESSAGGTGHPFGSSGLSCGDGNNCVLEGQYGGGSGVKQNTPGGSGGNATHGEGSNTSGSKAIGNLMVIPLSGGGGGACGNPQSGVGCNYSGSGGGGGGAILMFAQSITNVKISAQGANGQNGVGNSNGGGGAGGSIITASKLFIDNGINQSIFIKGGKAGGSTNQYGGWGRIRRDSPNWNVAILSSVPIMETFFQGPSSDTTRFIKPNQPFTITGTKRNSDSLLILLRPVSSQNWQKIDVIPSGPSLWDITLSLPKTDSVYYLLAMQYVPNPNKASQYYAEPDFVFSQAAANVLIMEKLPEIAGKDTLFADSVLACDGQFKLFKAKIYNIGDADLILSNSSFKHGYFSLETNINNVVVPPQDSVEITIRYALHPSHQSSFTDTLLIEHNDIWSGKANPWMIVISMKIKELNVITINDANASDIPSVHYTECLYDSQSYIFYIKNNSEEPLSLDGIISTNADVGTNILGSKIIQPGDTCSFRVYFKRAILANSSATLYYKFLECGNYLDSLSMTFDIIHTELEFLDDGLFPETRVGQYNEKTIRVRNIGTANANINSIAQPGNGFSIVSTNPSLPCVLPPNGELSLLVRFAPAYSGDPVRADLQVESEKGTDACDAIIELSLQGKAVESQVIISKYLMDFGTLYSCQSDLDTVYVKNPSSSTAPLTLTQQAEIIGSSQFAFAERPATNSIIQPGDSARIIVEFLEGGAGTYYGSLLIHTDDIASPQIYVQLTGTKDTLNLIATPDPIDLGDVPVGYEKKQTFRITNNGMLRVNLTDIKFKNPNVVASFYPNNASIPAGGYIDVELTITPTQNIQGQEFFDMQLSQCSWVSTASIVMNKLFADPNFNNALDFGVLSGCEDSTRHLLISNSGTAPFIVKSYQIIGADASLFEFAGQSVSFPATVTSARPFEFGVTFNPEATSNGNKAAQLIFEAEVNGIDIQITINLTGQKSSAIITNPPEIDFGGFVVGSIVDETLTISNAGFFTVQIDSIGFPEKYQGIFELTPDYTGAVLAAPSGQLTFNVRFTPQDTIRYEDTIFLYIYYNKCNEVIPIALSGSGLPARVLTLSIPNLALLDPRTTDYQIPIYGKTDIDTLQNYYIDTLEIKFNRSLFYPKSVSNGRFLYNTINGETRTIGIEINGINLPEVNTDATVASIIGDVLLGNQTSTPLEISKVVHSEYLRVSEVQSESGSLSVKVCPDGGDRLLEVYTHPVTMILTPNPASDILSISAELTETGSYTMELYDVLGNRVDILDTWTISLGQERSRELQVNVGKYSSGIYLLKLTTPTTYYSKILAISK